MGDLLKSIDSGSYFLPTAEGQLSVSSQKTIDAFNIKHTLQGLTPADKANIKTNLNPILVYARKNRKDIENMVSNLQVSENTLQKTVDDFQNSDIMSQLQKTKIDPIMLNIANDQYTDYFSFMVEYRYRLGIVGYKKALLKAELRKLDESIKSLQNYMATL
jgi:hypothetical protein